MKYPNSNRVYTRQKESAAHRGMSLEEDINRSNRYYLSHDIAVIHKKPTPITIVKVDYPKRSAAKITEAYFKLASTTDYNGIYLGKYIDFEAKECESETSFPFSSIHEHQIRHLSDVLRHGAIAFIPYDWIRENGFEIASGYMKPCDYLEVVERVFGLQGDL